ncbi:MAG: DUF362 domain-containing protein [Candidatus Bathyarchaeota archaeon]|jgi:uncharacterized protein (DUF362 family)
MASKVAIIELGEDVQESFGQALKLIGSTKEWNTTERPVVIKVGVFNHKGSRTNYPTVGVVGAIARGFNKASKVYLAESDNTRGTGSERLQIWKKLFTKRVAPFNLSEDTNKREVKIADEKIGLSSILLEPNIFVSTHALRRYKKGTILKNLLGLIPDRKKARFHKKLVAVLLDLYEAIGGIDLAVLDATRTYSGPAARRAIDSNVIVVGRDAIAVEAVGATLVGLKPEKMPVIQEAVNRGLGEGDVTEIEVLGNSIESLKERFRHL